MRSLVGCRIQKTWQSDTFPFLAQGKIGGKSAFFCAVKNAWLSGDQLIRIRPLDAGIYFYEARLTSKTLNMVYVDTLQVQNNDLEMSVRGQNTMLLNSFARPIEPNNTSAVRRMMTRDPGLAKNITVMRKIQIKQSWWLLILLFCFLGMEWLIRRKIGLDS